MKPFLHGLLVKFLEAFHRTIRHHEDGVHYLLLVFSQKLQSQEKQKSKMCENIRILALHEFDVIFSELEGCFFEVHITWTTRNHKAKVNMDDMTLCVY